MPHRIRVMMADDHTMFRNAILNEININPEMRATGGASDGKDLIKQIGEQEPHVVVLDVEMPGMDGFETFSHIRKNYPAIKLIMLSTHFSWPLVDHFLNNGAGAYLPKTCDTTVLIEAIDAVLKRGYYLETLKLLPAKDRNQIFTDREVQITKGICMGKTNAEIGLDLEISNNTVDFHRKNIYEKAGVCNAVELTHFAIRNGFISLYGQFFKD